MYRGKHLLSINNVMPQVSFHYQYNIFGCHYYIMPPPFFSRMRVVFLSCSIYTLTRNDRFPNNYCKNKQFLWVSIFKFFFTAGRVFLFFFFFDNSKFNPYSISNCAESQTVLNHWHSFIIMLQVVICRWKWHWKITATLKFNITKGNAALKIFQCYLSVIFSVVFVWHNEDDSRIEFSHNNSEPNRIIIGLNFQCDYIRFNVANKWLKIWNGIEFG